MLTGDNGILQKATTAKENTDSAQIKERIQLAYHSALTEGQGSYTKNSLEEELIKEFGNDFEEVDDSDYTNWILKAKGQSVTIPAGKEGEFIPLTSDELNGQLLGMEVEYSGYTANYTGGWRVFYATDEETFIITTDIIDSTIAFGGTTGIPLVSRDGNTTYTGSFDVANSEYGRIWNKIWVIDQIHQSIEKENGENPVSLQQENRHKATAYLCDANNWTAYKTESANYVVGGPTEELFLKSWSKRTGGTEISISGITDYGYPTIIKSGISQSILRLNGNGKGLYNNGTAYWIVSPSSNSTSSNKKYQQLFIGVKVNGGDGSISENGNEATFIGVRPLASIPTSKLKKNKDGTKLIIIP